jgi:hypothetical protein
MRVLAYLCGIALFSVALAAQQVPPAQRAPSGGSSGLTVAQIEKPSTESWPTYNGDYSGRRFSTLTKINASNVKHLSLAWIYDLPAARSRGQLGPARSKRVAVRGPQECGRRGDAPTRRRVTSHVLQSQRSRRSRRAVPHAGARASARWARSAAGRAGRCVRRFPRVLPAAFAVSQPCTTASSLAPATTR